MLDVEVEGEGGGGGGDDRNTPPVHASRRAMYVANPVFHRISSRTARRLFRFRVCTTLASESGLSYLYGSAASVDSVGSGDGDDELVERSRHWRGVLAWAGEGGDGHVQSSRMVSRRRVLAARAAASRRWRVLGSEEERRRARRGVGVGQVGGRGGVEMEVVGELEDREGRVSADEFCIGRWDGWVVGLRDL